ncbi:hypothetical protein NEISUBOT_03164 [Neisseria subflava NJ9703]|uniref:Uncharacterized protein n=1 Tax=Neisseria subflava NJ9703 TaxID=546268 RepID=A0A9W5N0E0_NEISU|nr:hypothetical protein NEISUBOT_03164 [Neisseria subflava NJ9703]
MMTAITTAFISFSVVSDGLLCKNRQSSVYILQINIITQA